MKLTKTAGKNTLSVTRKEWERIGKQNGWMKTAQPGPPKLNRVAVTVEMTFDKAPGVDPVEQARKVLTRLVQSDPGSPLRHWHILDYKDVAEFD